MANNEGINVGAALAAVEAAEQAPAPESQVPVVKAVEQCPRCGYNATEKKIEVKEDDRREYYRSLMGLRPFIKICELWNGDLQITFTTLSPEETDTINRRIRSLDVGEAGEMLELSMKIKVMVMCRRVVTTEQTLDIVPPEDMDAVDINTQFAKMFPVPEQMIRAISRAFTEFEMVCDILNLEGFDENFYKGGGAA